MKQSKAIQIMKNFMIAVSDSMGVMEGYDNESKSFWDFQTKKVFDEERVTYCLNISGVFEDKDERTMIAEKIDKLITKEFGDSNSIYNFERKMRVMEVSGE